MHLAHPQFLWLLLMLPAAAYWRLRRRKAAALPHADLRLLDDLPAGSARWAEWIGLGVRLVVAVLLIVALSRPRWPDETTRIPARSLAVLLVLDISGSMAEPYDGGEQPPHPRPLSSRGERGEKVQPLSPEKEKKAETLTRLAAAQRALRIFIQGEGPIAGRTDDLVGLVTFAARSENIVPPTLSHSVLLRVLDEAEPIGRSPDSDTNIGDAMAEGLDLLHRATPEQKVMIVLSDGEHNVRPEVVPNALKPSDAARLAADPDLGVRVHTIYVGPGVPSESPTEGRKALQEVADISGGRSFEAHDAQALVEVCAEIGRLERTRIESFQYYRYFEAFPLIGLSCIILLLILRTLESTRWLKVP